MREVKTWVYLRLHFARACVHLRGRNQNNLYARQRKFFRVCTPSLGQSKLSDVHCNLLANEIQDTSAFKWGFYDLRKLARLFGHPTQVFT